MSPEGLRGRGLRALERYAEEIGVTLVSERRSADRRSGCERRAAERSRFRPIEYRTIRNPDGRRIAERRAVLVPLTPPHPLPRRLRAHSEELHFVEPLEISPEHVEDVETARLLVRIQGGEPERFRALYHRWFDRVYTYARAGLGRAVLAEIATQEVFAELQDALPRHEIGSVRFRAWIAGMTSRRIHAHLIAMSGIDTAAAAEPARPHQDVDRTVPSWVKDADLQVLLMQLPALHRDVMMLRYLMGLSQVEVAEVVERSATTVRDLHTSAICSLAERQHAIGEPSVASSMRFAMARRLRVGRVTQSRRLALTPS